MGSNKYNNNIYVSTVSIHPINFILFVGEKKKLPNVFQMQFQTYTVSINPRWYLNIPRIFLPWKPCEEHGQAPTWLWAKVNH